MCRVAVERGLSLSAGFFRTLLVVRYDIAGSCVTLFLNFFLSWCVVASSGGSFSASSWARGVSVRWSFLCGPSAWGGLACLVAIVRGLVL